MTTAKASNSVTARISGLENDSTYMALLNQEQVLKVKEDSIQKQINDIRANFASVAQEDRTSVGRLILDAENNLFEVRNQTGIVTSKINSIEQAYIIENLNKPKAAATEEEATAQTEQSYSSKGNDLYSSSFFEQMLSAEDLATLKKANALEPTLYLLEDQFLVNYKNMSLLRSDYASCDNQYTADTIKNMFSSIQDINSVVIDSIAQSMNYIFDNKLYTFSYIYDKMSNSHMLSKLENDLSQMRSKMAQRTENNIDANIYNLPIQRRFLLDQEISLASYLKMSGALDSLSTLRTKQNDADNNLPEVVIEDRIFIEYAPIEVVKTPLYNSSNPIPKLEHYKRGTVYRIFVGSFTRAQAVSIFRSTTPVYHDQLNNMHDYYIGGFATLEEANKAQADLKKIGFRKPEVCVWIDDVFENLSASGSTSSASSASSSSSSAKSSAAKNFYRVEILMNDTSASLSATHQQNISELASGKELSKMVSSEGLPIFVVGTFNNINEAEALASSLNENGDCSASVKAL